MGRWLFLISWVIAKFMKKYMKNNIWCREKDGSSVLIFLTKSERLEQEVEKYEEEVDKNYRIAKRITL